MLTTIGIPATIVVRPDSLRDYIKNPIAFAFPVMVAVCLASIRAAMSRRAQFLGFISSCGYLSFMLTGAAFGLFPVLLPGVGVTKRDLTVAQALSGYHTLQVGLVWWCLGIGLAIMYFAIIYWLFRGKISVIEAGYEH